MHPTHHRRKAPTPPHRPSAQYYLEQAAAIVDEFDPLFCRNASRRVDQLLALAEASQQEGQG